MKKLENQIFDKKHLIRDLQVFNSSISHELKAPIRAIDGYARIFMDDYGEHVDESGIALISNIRHICSDTLVLINKLVEYTKFSNIEPKNEPIDLKELIQSIFDELSESDLVNNKIELYFAEKLPIISSDRFLIKQVITNIISNSLKFTRNKEHGMITIGYQYKDDIYTFYIRDNGVGFDMKFSEKLFGMFERMHTIDDFEGSGLGLAIIKNIIQKLGGTVWITGEVGKGACTYFSIPQKNVLK